MSEVRALYRPNREAAPLGDGLPDAYSKADKEARAEIGGFLDAVLMRPLWSSDGDRNVAIIQALETMTIPERVFIELEMRDRQKSFYTSEYDPLR